VFPFRPFFATKLERRRMYSHEDRQNTGVPRKLTAKVELRKRVRVINPRGFLAANFRFSYLHANETDTAEKFSLRSRKMRA